MCELVSENAINFSFNSASALGMRNVHVRVVVSGLISAIPSIADNSPRTEAAQPPHVMNGSLSLTRVIEASSVFDCSGVF